MNKRLNIQQEVEKTLASIDQIDRAKANPFLFTRIQARLREQNNPWERTLGILSRPVIAIAMVLVVLLANAWTIYKNGNPVEMANGNNAVQAHEDSEGYDLAVNTFYDYETPER